MSSETLAKALGLIERAEQAMQKVRTETPVSYMDDDAAQGAVNKQMLGARDDLENAIEVMFSNPDQPAPDELDAFSKRNGPARRTFSYLTVEHQAGRLPQSKNAPWPPHEWAIEDNMRAEATEAEAEPATNGYDQSSQGGA
jgi:hypothetical protein